MKKNQNVSAKHLFFKLNKYAKLVKPPQHSKVLQTSELFTDFFFPLVWGLVKKILGQRVYAWALENSAWTGIVQVNLLTFLLKVQPTLPTLFNICYVFQSHLSTVQNCMNKERYKLTFSDFQSCKQWNLFLNLTLYPTPYLSHYVGCRSEKTCKNLFKNKFLCSIFLVLIFRIDIWCSSQWVGWHDSRYYNLLP